ncbi:Smr/MutS family protein [Xanthovirga aplysinae]|uniref:Smr/MutS family protein n=1 Tax=Xanthovirga aplysinae TaxID=2529853 RepID=UPI0012BBA5FC|nr:DUF2027 domain-containing protein [Xanthovirga aplysinae]MTI31490.1 DUF2027 domain-containing protein [Xanthovirga aplysinae]
MNIGDKVRLLHDDVEGVITRFLDSKLIEIEIEDGFTIPVMKNEAVVVSSGESSFFEEKKETAVESKKEIKSEIIAQRGVFIAFLEINDKVVSLHLINNTDLQLPFSAFEELKDQYNGLKAGTLQPRESMKIGEREIRNFEKWPPILIQLLFFKNEDFKLKNPLQRVLKFKASTFFKSKQKAPVLGKNAFLFQLDNEAKNLDTANLKEQLYTQTENKTITSQSHYDRPEPIIDLHIDKLIDDFSEMNKREILSYQIQHFEAILDKAIACGMEEITFIHGVGNGVLKNEIHKRLGKTFLIKYYEDALKEKFGYGATRVKIR